MISKLILSLCILSQILFLSSWKSDFPISIIFLFSGISSDIYYKADCTGNKFPQFLLVWENIYPSLLKDNFTEYRILGCGFFFQKFIYLIPPLFTYITYEKYEEAWYNSYSYSSIGKVPHSHPLPQATASFKTFSFPLALCSLTMTPLGIFGKFIFIQKWVG